MDYRILDCTLRDGGYYTNWDFEDELIAAYLRSVSGLPISAVEVGYCNPPLPGYNGEWFYLGKHRLERVRAELRSDQELAIMLDAKNCLAKQLPSLLSELAGIIDLVRLAVAPKESEHALSLASVLKDLGFKVGLNSMYLSTYSRDLDELQPLLAGAASIDVLSLVDSYGGCTPRCVGSMVEKAIAMFPGTPIGFHGHDNTCLGYANSLAAVDAGAKTIDATFLGMGRGAGNARTEMLLVHQSGLGTTVDFDLVSEVVTKFDELRLIHNWGTSLPYMISGAANLPQKDVMDWMGKHRYSATSVVRALKNQSDGELDLREHTDLGPGDLPDIARGSVVIVGGGPSVAKHLPAIRDFCTRSGALVVHANTCYMKLAGTFGNNELICLAGHASHALPRRGLPDTIAGFVVPRPPRFGGSVPDSLPRAVFQAKAFPPMDAPNGLGPVSDIGPLSLAIGAARALGAGSIYLVGFDGYENASVAQQELAQEIQLTINQVAAEGRQDIVSLTPTRYKVTQRSIYAEARSLEP